MCDNIQMNVIPSFYVQMSKKGWCIYKHSFTSFIGNLLNNFLND